MVSLPTQLTPVLEHSLREWHAAMASRATGRIWVAVYFPASLISSAAEPLRKNVCAVWPPTPSLSTETLTYPRRETLIANGAVSEAPELRDWLPIGATQYVRISAPAYAYQATDYLVFSDQPLGDDVAPILGAVTYSMFPKIRAGLRAQFSPLTAKEAMVLASAFSGETAHETAARTGVSLRMVNSYVQSAKTKLGSPSRLAAIQWAHWLGHF